MDLQDIKKRKDAIDELKEELVQCVVDDQDLFADVNIVQLVSFSIDKIEYGVDILAVHDILRMPDITRLPNTPDFIKGVINLRGNVVPVVDIKRRFGLARAKFTDSSRIIVIETNSKLVGLLVDNVNQVVRLPETNINPHSELIDGISEEFIQGIGRMRDRLIIILTLSHILFEEEKEVMFESQ